MQGPLIELILRDAGNRLLIPLDSITSISEVKTNNYHEGFTVVYVKDLYLYIIDYIDKDVHEYQGIEAIQVTNDYNALKFILMGKSKLEENNE